MKRIISLMLSVLLLVGCLSAAAMPTAADGYTTLTAAEYGTLVNYSLLGDSAIDMKLKSTAYMQSFSDITANGLRDKTYISAVSFSVSAPADGSYSIKPEFTLKNDLSDYFMTVCVNDADTYKVLAANAGDYSESVSVKLKAGVNIIRLIARLKETADIITASNDVAVNGLSIEGRLTAEAKGTSLKVLPNNCTKNYYQEGTGGGVGGAGTLLSNAHNRKLTPENIKIGDISLIPFFALTINAPKAGFYDISISALTGAEGATGKFVVFVDAQKYIFDFMDYTTAGELDASVYIPAGNHTISVTSVYDWKSDVAVGGVTQEYYRSWSNYYYIEFESGSVSLSATQIEPKTIIDSTRIEAENVTSNVLSSDPAQVHGGCSGGKCSGGFNADFSKAQSYSSLTSYFDKSNTPSVSFSVYAPTAGTYTLTPGYYCYAKRDTYYMTVLINDSVAKTVSFVDRGNDSGWNGATFTADLSKGVNVIRLIVTTSDGASNMSGNYINIDYLDLSGSLSGFSNDQYRIEAENSKFHAYFNTVGSPALAGEDTGKPTDYGAYSGNFSAETFYRYPHFGYSVYAPRDGYYDISLAFNSGYDISYGEALYGLVVDSKSYIKKARKYSGGNDFNKNRINMSVYLTKGDHNLAFTAQMPTNLGGTYYWHDFDALLLYGGLVVAANQESPFTVTYEAETAYLHNMTTVWDNTTTYSFEGYAGLWKNGATQSIDELSSYIDPDSGYTVFSVVAPREADYRVNLRFKFNTDPISQADYDAFKAKYGMNPYAVLVANGRTYKVEHPTYCDWVSTANDTVIHLKEGLNQIYAMAMTTEVANEFTSPFINFDSLLIPGELTIAEPTYYTLGDANGDGKFSLSDYLRVKRYLAGDGSTVDRQAVNFTASPDYPVNADTLTEIKKWCMFEGTPEYNAKYGGVQQAIEAPSFAPDGRVSLNDEKIYYSPYSWNTQDGSRYAPLPGAYIKVAFTGSTLGLRADLSRIAAVAPSSFYLHAYIDGSSTPIIKTLADVNTFGILPFTTSLGSGNHYAEIYFSGSTSGENAYVFDSINSVRITGLKIADGAKLLNLSDVGKAPSAKKVIFHGDSITEGIGTYNYDENGYAPTIARALGLEYGQQGNSSSGWCLGGSRALQPFYIPDANGGFGTGTWRYISQHESRFVDDDPSKGYKDGTPDVVVINMGENDTFFPNNGTKVQERIKAWLTDMRKAVPASTQIFVIVPFNFNDTDGSMRAEYPIFKEYLVAGYNEYVAANPSDTNLHLLDLGSWATDLVYNNSYNNDRIHPNAACAKQLGERLAELMRPYI